MIPQYLKYSANRLKYVVRLRRSRPKGCEVDRPYVGLEHLEPRTGRFLGNVERCDNNASEESVNSILLSNVFESGDVLFGKLRPYLAKAWVAEFPGYATTELLVFVPLKVEARFLRYVCLSSYFIDIVDGSTYGSKMPRSDWSFIGDICIPVPKYCEQSIIADYLDRETGHIDSLVAAKERLLDLLFEKRNAFITQAVTRGLDPNITLRDSGTPWLGRIPYHWEVRKLAWLFRERDERGDPHLPLLEVSLASGVTVRMFLESRIESTIADYSTYKIARHGDIVFNKMRMWQGAVGAAPNSGLVSPDYVVAEPINLMSSSYAALLFRIASFSAECGRRSHGIVWDRLRLYWDGFRDIEVPLPPLSEQSRIVEVVARELERLDVLMSEAERSIGLLKERRIALITAAVTGQIDMEEMAA